MAQILQEVNKKHAFSSNEVKYYALYGYYFLGHSKSMPSKTHSESISTITSWITHFEDNRTLGRPKRTRIPSKCDEQKRIWIQQLYHDNPILHLDEAKVQFKMHFNITISTSHIFQILHANNMSWKTLEKRAIQIRDSEIVKFICELNAIDWTYSNLVFLDEVSMDNQGLLRTKGYGLIGERLIYRGEFTRKPMMSMLAFLGQNGILDTYITDGTFNRLKFFANCKDFALGGICQQYPGRNSVWILDGAKIHCHPSIIRYLRSLGILPIFLPAHSPFFNPIEYIFGVVKKHLKRSLATNKKNIELSVNEEFTKMRNFSCTKIFKECGYIMSGKFDPKVAYEQNMKEFGFK